MNDILLKITNGDRTLAQACNHLVYPAAYAPGDSITMTVPEPGYYVIRLDDAMNEDERNFFHAGNSLCGSANQLQPASFFRTDALSVGTVRAD